MIVPKFQNSLKILKLITKKLNEDDGYFMNNYFLDESCAIKKKS